MRKLHQALCGIMLAGMVGGLAACAQESSALSGPSEPTSQAMVVSAVPQAAGIRLRCERRSNRSKISVDGRNLRPAAGTFRARVRAGGGTVRSAAKKAAGGEAEFDFDSDPGDVRAGATRISASFIRSRSGPDVVAEILNAQGQVVASQGADCQAR